MYPCNPFIHHSVIYTVKSRGKNCYTSYLVSQSLSASIEIQSNINTQLEDGKLERHTRSHTIFVRRWEWRYY